MNCDKRRSVMYVNRNVCFDFSEPFQTNFDLCKCIEYKRGCLAGLVTQFCMNANHMIDVNPLVSILGQVQ